MAVQATRRLAAILMGDIAGYSRLMGGDERRTVERVETLFTELINPTIAEHRGHLVGTRGDGFLAVFDSPVESVRCAIVIQQSMVTRNLEIPERDWIRFRIGVNLGDIIVQGENVQGDGVNIASRLEGLADPGEIFISAGIYEQIRHKLVCGYQPLGERRVKNITDPVSVYRVLPDPGAVAQIAARQRYRKIALRSGAGIAIVAAGAMWYAWSGSDALDSSAAPPQKPAQPLQTAVRQTPPPAAVTPQPVPAIAPRDEPVTQPPLPQQAPQPGALRPATGGATYSRQDDSKQQAPLSKPPGEQQAFVAPSVQRKPESPAVADPEMVFIAGGTFQMGSQEDSSERPIHRVTVPPFFIGKYPVTGKQWRDCVRNNGCRDTTQNEDNAPISNVSWNDTQDYVKWLSQTTKRSYRLPTEAEWEFAARAGSDTHYWWGNAMKYGYAVCRDCGDSAPPTKVGSHQANPFGVFDIGGGVSEWVEDCWFRDYNGAPTNGSARQMADCRDHVMRGGSYRNDASYVRSASRDYYDSGVRYPTHGFRVARSQ